MTEWTPPVQQNFYAVGHKYRRDYDEKQMTYLGSVTLSDGTVDHVFWHELQNQNGKRFCMTDSYSDDFCTHFIVEDA